MPMSRYVLLVCLLLGCYATSLAQQAPFRGGAGDGYDRVSLRLSTATQAPAVASPLRVYPQPAAVGQGWHLSIEGARLAVGRWQLLDGQGRLLQSGNWTGDLRLGTHGLAPGLYLWRVLGQPWQQRLWLQ